MVDKFQHFGGFFQILFLFVECKNMETDSLRGHISVPSIIYAEFLYWGGKDEPVYFFL